MPDDCSLIGTVLDGKYAVDRLLGKGGMGEVYAGTHLALGRLVAIKVLHAAHTDNQSFVSRFEREARTTAMLEHPNAVHIHDFGTVDDGSRYLVMEYIEGVTLRDVLRTNGSIPLGIAVEMIRQAAGAVGEAHGRGIVHRDVKPENLMVRRDAEGRLVLKVVDFGLAKMLAGTASLLTKASEIMGTPRYMAPEQFQGLPVDGRADVYALGCVFFELLTGEPPYDGTMMEIVGQHVHAEVPRVSDRGVEIPAEVESALHRALAKDADARTVSAEAFALELEAAIANTDLSAELCFIPEPAYASVTETSDPSDVTAMPGVPIVRAMPSPPKSIDTLAGAYVSNSVGTSKPTVVVNVPPPNRRSYRVPAALGLAGIVLVAGMMWQGAGAETTAPGPSIPQASPAAEPAVQAETLSENPAQSTVEPSPASRANPSASTAASRSPEPTPEKKDNRGILPTVGAKTKGAVVGTGRQMKRLGGKLRRGIPGLKPKNGQRR